LRGRETFRAWTATIGTHRGLFTRWLLPLQLVPIACSLVERDLGVLVFSSLVTFWVGCLAALSLVQRVTGKTLVVGADGFRIEPIFGEARYVAFREVSALGIEGQRLSWTVAAETVHLYLEPCDLVKLFDAMARSGIGKRPTPSLFAPGFPTAATMESRWEAFRERRTADDAVATRFRVSVGEDTYRVADVDESELAGLVTDPTLDVPTRLEAARRLVQMSAALGATAAQDAADTTANATFARELGKLTSTT
jgi:hypothetical protein